MKKKNKEQRKGFRAFNLRRWLIRYILTQLVAFLTALGFLWPVRVRAGGSGSVASLSTRIITADSGKLLLEVSGTAPDTTDWLGISFYLPGYTDPTWQAEHAVYPVKKGQFKNSYPVPAGYEKGSYEVALWKEKLAEKWFYLPAGMRGYGTGWVRTGAVKVTLADTIAPLKTEIVTVNGSKMLKISGNAPDKINWLGISFYKEKYADAVLDGEYQMLSLSQGRFSRTIPVPKGYETGSYEVAVWQKVISRKRVFRLGTQLAYKEGKIGE